MSFDPVSRTWTPAASAGLEPTGFYEGRDASQTATWADDEIYIWTGWVGTSWDQPFTNVVTYDPENSSWEILEPAPIPAQGMWHEPIFWTGSELITYTDPMLLYTPQ